MTDQQTGPGAAPDASGMPMLGLGTWENTDPEACAESVRTAIETGYRHIDTAQAYGNEADVGRGIAAADVPREELFVATKVWIDQLSREDVLSSTRESLEKLGTEYADLLYVHWPAGDYDPEETLAALAELKAEGSVERIGVSNFEPDHVERAREALGEYPFANQVEIHPLLQQRELREYAAETGVELVAYSPLARGTVFDVPELSEIADRHGEGVSEAQVSLAWLREKGVTAIPKATGADHIADNWASLDLELTEEDVATIDAIDREDRRVHPSFAPAAW